MFVSGTDVMLLISSAAVDLVSSPVLLVTILVSDYRKQRTNVFNHVKSGLQTCAIDGGIDLTFQFLLRGCNVIEKKRLVEPLHRAAGCAITCIQTVIVCLATCCYH